VETRWPIPGRDAPGAGVWSDRALVERWVAGADPSALELLVRRHGGMVCGVCRRMLGDTPDADDAFQATFLILVRKAKSLDRPEQVAGWLHRVALRVARKVRADRTRRQMREVAIVDLAAPTRPEDVQILRQELDEELDRLPEKYRLPIVLCELEGHTLEEAAQLLGWPKGTVAGRLSRGRDLLRRRLSRRRGVVLPLLLMGGFAPTDQLVSATVETASSGATATSRPATLADAALRSGRWWLSVLVLLILMGGALAVVPWHARATPGGPAALVEPPRSTPITPQSVAPAAPTVGCHHCDP
jgi:RNA polymerase sigma factor (sigma-70 family)